MKAIITATLLGACAAGAAQPEAREWKAPNGIEVKYRISAPAKIETGKTYPLVLFLHGRGESGDDNTAQLKHGVTSILKGAEKIGEPCFLIAPQCPVTRWWAPVAGDRTRTTGAAKPNDLLEAVLALVDETAKNQPVDTKRLYLTGLSMGGFGTWDLLGRAPGKFAAAVPICGGGEPEMAAKFGDTPIHAFHGEADSVVPVAATKDMIAAVKKTGAKPKMTLYPGVNHDSWTRTYDNIDVIRWIFQQKKSR